jgi:hypothetical protein
MATLTLKNVYADQPPAAATTLYTTPAGTTAKVIKCTVCNDTTVAMTFKAYKIPTGESVGDAYLILNDQTVGSKESLVLSEVEGQILDTGDSIVLHPSLANQLSTMLDVVEMT